MPSRRRANLLLQCHYLPGRALGIIQMKHGLPIILLLASLLGGALCFCVLASMQRDFDPATFGLGLNTTSHSAHDGEQCISNGCGIESVVDYFKQLSGTDRKVVLWVGASQLHAINNFQPGDNLAVHYVTEEAKRRNSQYTFLLSSQANASFHDLLATYLFFRQQGLTPDWLVVAVVYDDLREDKIQPWLVRRLTTEPGDAVAVGGKAVERVLARAEAIQSGGDEKQEAVQRNATAGTPQEALEEALVAGLGATLPGYAYVGNLSARISIKVRILLADLMSGKLNQTRALPIPKRLEDWNHEALLSILELARADGCKVLLYRQPHRPSGGEFYHDRAAFDAYFERVKGLADPARGVYVLDLETIVPARYYGLTNSGRPDVFHFTDAGHRLLAERIGDVFWNIEEAGSSAVQ